MVILKASCLASVADAKPGVELRIPVTQVSRAGEALASALDERTLTLSTLLTDGGASLLEQLRERGHQVTGGLDMIGQRIADHRLAHVHPRAVMVAVIAASAAAQALAGPGDPVFGSFLALMVAFYTLARHRTWAALVVGAAFQSRLIERLATSDPIPGGGSAAAAAGGGAVARRAR